MTDKSEKLSIRYVHEKKKKFRIRTIVMVKKWGKDSPSKFVRGQYKNEAVVVKGHDSFNACNYPKISFIC